MTQGSLPFQYREEKNESGLTGFSGLPLYIELSTQIGFVEYINQTMQTKERGWTDAEMNSVFLTVRAERSMQML